jgi:putative toxin-antitoxin system antitoxin component (TIGR02293 family)
MPWQSQSPKVPIQGHNRPQSVITQTCHYVNNNLPLWHITAYPMSMALPDTKSVAPVTGPATLMTGTRIGKALGLKSMEIPSLMRAAQSGLSWSAVRKFLDIIGLSQLDLAGFLLIPERTFARRREAGTFDRRESEQLLRLAEISEAALDLFDGDSVATRTWLTSPVRGLGNARPIDFAQSEFGAREVRDLIGRLSDGVFS